MAAFLSLFLATSSLLFLIVTCRLLWIFRRPRPSSRAPGTPTHLLVVLGSGGHTAEMFSLLRDIDTTKYTHRTYVVSSGDNFSAELARKFETDLDVRAEREGRPPTVSRIAIVPRARRIHQSLLTTPVSCLWCLLSCLRILGQAWDEQDSGSGRAVKQSAWPTSVPDVILTNGPATAVIVVVASILLRFAGMGGSRQKMRTVYVESWARVKHLSLSGKILLRVADRFVVQWKSLREVGSRAECLGCLVGG